MIAVAAHRRMRLSALVAFVRKERGVDPAVDDQAPRARAMLPDLIAAQRVAGMDADADNVAGGNGVRIQRIQRLVDEDRLAIFGRRRRREDEQPSWRDHSRTEGDVTGIDQMYAHLQPRGKRKYRVTVRSEARAGVQKLPATFRPSREKKPAVATAALVRAVTDRDAGVGGGCPGLLRSAANRDAGVRRGAPRRPARHSGSMVRSTAAAGFGSARRGHRQSRHGPLTAVESGISPAAIGSRTWPARGVVSAGEWFTVARGTSARGAD